MARMINFTITCLLVWSKLIVSANDCRVRDKYSPELWNGDPLKILAFTSDQDGFTCMLNFQKLNNYLFYDKIVLSNNGNKVIRARHGNMEYLDMYSTLNDTGWNEFTFFFDDNSTFMVTVRDKLVFNYTVQYPVKTITTYGNNISLCSSPSWAVGENGAIVIPLYARPQDIEGTSGSKPSNSSIYLTLSSTASFNPIIQIDGIKRFLTMKNGEILLSQKNFQPLHLKKYILEVYTQNQKVNINCKLGNDSKKLIEFQVATVLSYIEILSQGMSFTVDLDLSSILFTTSTLTTATTITTKTPSALAVTTNDDFSTGLVVGIIITILALLALVIIILFYKRRKRSSMTTLSSGFHEETQQDDGNYRNSKSEIEIFIDDKNLVSFHEQKQHCDGNYSSSIPELATLIEIKDEISDDRDQFKNNAKEYFEDTEDGTANSIAMPVNKEHESGSLTQRELLSPIIFPPDHDVTMDHPSPRYTSSRPNYIQGTQTYVFQSENIPLSHREKSNHSQSIPAFSYNCAPPLAVDRNTNHNKLSQNTNKLVDYSILSEEVDFDESLSISEEDLEYRINQNQELGMSVIDKVEMYVTKGDNERAIETLINAIFHINQSEVAHDESSKDLIMTLQEKLDYLNPEIKDNINPDGVQPLLSFTQLSISPSAANRISSNYALADITKEVNVKGTREAYGSGKKSRKSQIKGASKS